MVAPYPSFEEVKQLLASSAMRDYEQALAEGRGVPLLSYSLGVPSGMQRKLYLADLSADRASQLLQTEGARLLAFSLSLFREDTRDIGDGEFAEGEEQDQSEPSEPGSSSG